MGTAIGDIVPRQKISLEALNGKTLAFDSHNILYQFLSSIRGEDGTPLKDSHGNVTSHLAGLFYRTINLLEKGVKPVFVFDGKPSELKAQTLQKRHAARTQAFELHAKAISEGNMEDAKKFGSRALRLDQKMVDEAKELVALMGLPVVLSPGEGEAQASFMARNGKVDGIVSQDYDSLLFGTPVLYRNVGVSGKRKVPGRNIWVDVEPEKIVLEQVFLENSLSREKLIWIAILVGTDFNEKFPKIGIKTALKLVKESKSFEDVMEKAKFAPEFNYKDIESLFLSPSVDPSAKFSFGKPNRDGLIKFLSDRHNFSYERVEKAVSKLVLTSEEKSRQKTLGDWS